MGNKKFLVVVRAGNASLHPGWLLPPEERSWDIVVSYFGDDPDLYKAEGVRRIDHKGSKWQGLSQLFQSQAVDLSGYRYVWLPDDDLKISGQLINLFFRLCEALDLEIAQPALDWSSYYSHAVTLQNRRFQYRYVNFVEVMAPCVRHDLLTKILPSFGENASGWGLDYLWQKHLSSPAGGAAVIDAIPMTHTRPVGSAGHGTANPGQVDPRQEMAELFARHAISPAPHLSLAGLTADSKQLNLWQHREEFLGYLMLGICDKLETDPVALAQMVAAHGKVAIDQR